MSSSVTRRYKRFIERQKSKGKYVELSNPYGEREFNIPSEDDVQDYILDKTREIRMDHKQIKIEPNGMRM